MNLNIKPKNINNRRNYFVKKFNKYLKYFDGFKNLGKIYPTCESFRKINLDNSLLESIF